MKKISKKYILRTLLEEKLWKVGEEDCFKHGKWELSITREQEKYFPFKFTVNGQHENGSRVSRRYPNMESAFLHIVNNFNENADKKDEYLTIEDYLVTE